MTIINKSMVDIVSLSIYMSSNFTILDMGIPMFYYFAGSNDQSNLYGIILPEKENKVYIEITVLNGDILAMGTYSRDQAIQNSF